MVSQLTDSLKDCITQVSVVKVFHAQKEHHIKMEKTKTKKDKVFLINSKVLRRTGHQLNKIINFWLWFQFTLTRPIVEEAPGKEKTKENGHEDRSVFSQNNFTQKKTVNIEQTKKGLERSKNILME